MRIHTWILLSVFCTSIPEVKAQVSDTLVMPAISFNGELLPLEVLEEVRIRCDYTLNTAQYAKYKRLRNAVYVTYPYARRAAAIMNNMNAKLAKMPNKKDRKQYIKSREKELKKEFTDPLSNLSVYQGKILMKLIHRETGENCYEIIKEMRGGMNARIYQTVAFFYNSNLKQHYHPEGEDQAIEYFVKQMQRQYGYADLHKKKETGLLQLEGQ
jgi:hypothetical protein